MNFIYNQDSAIWSIEKLVRWDAGSWKKYAGATTNLYIKLKCDQMIIFNNNTVLETLNLNMHTKGFIKDYILIFAISDNVAAPNVRKIKFKFSCGRDDIEKCINNLRLFCSIIERGTKIYSGSTTATPTLRTLDEKIGCIMTHLDEQKETKIPMLPSAQLTDFAKICILDPTFPDIVEEMENILKKMNIHKI